MALIYQKFVSKLRKIDRSLLKLLSERHRLAYDVVRSKVTQKALRDLERDNNSYKSLCSLLKVKIISLNHNILRQSSKDH